MTTVKTPSNDRTAGARAKANGVKKVVVNGAEPDAAKTAIAVAAAEVEAAKPKHKLVRDSFTIPKSEYAVLDALKLRAARLMRPTKKSEVLRAGIAALQSMNDEAFLAVINGVPSLKTGRPKATPPSLPAAKSAAK